MQTLLADASSDDVAATLRAQGWEADEEPAAAVADRYGRDLGDPVPARPGGAQGSEPPIPRRDDPLTSPRLGL
jgi:hypothetical protein